MPGLHYWLSGTALFPALSFAFGIAVGLVGIKAMIPRRTFWVLLVGTVILSAISWENAAQQESDADLLGSQVVSVNQNLQKIARAAYIDPSLSAQAVADKVIARLDSMQSELETDTTQIHSIQHPLITSDGVYRKGQLVGTYASLQYDPIDNKVIIGVITVPDLLNFPANLDIGGDLLACAKPNGGGVFSSGAEIHYNYGPVYCDVLGQDPEAPRGARGILFAPKNKRVFP